MKNAERKKSITTEYTPLEEYMAVRSYDNSMVNVGILTDSIVILHKQREAADGEVVVAVWGKKAYVRKYKRFGQSVMLTAANGAYDPIVAERDEVLILGKVVQVVNYFN